MDKLTKVIGVLLVAWCVVYISHGLEYFRIMITPNQHQAVFLGLLLPLAFLTFPAKKGGKPGRWYDWILIVISVVPCFYVVFFYNLWMINSSTTTRTYELIFGTLVFIALLEGLRRVVGIVLPIVTLFFIIHPLLSVHLPGFLFGRSYSLERVGTMIYMQPDGIFSLPLNVAATIIIAFLLFGQLLLISGGGQTLIDIALSIVGRVRGGGAKSAIVASGLFGSLSGSPAANVAITGTFTIPLMKSTGYKPSFAGAVEASASTGGTVLPPVMGIVAFIMAEWLNVAYIQIAIKAFIPALILYLGMFAQVDFAAARAGLRRIPSSGLPSTKETVKKGFVYLIPIAVLIFSLFGLMYSPETSVLWATISILIITSFRRNTRLSLKQIADSMSESAKSSVIIGLACAMAGIMMASVAMTGLAASLSNIIVEFAAGRMFILLLLSALASFVFGMGIGSIPSYIFVAIMVAPALTEMGIKPIAAHLFVFWIAMSAFITPPFCVSAYVASAIAKSHPMITGLQAIRIGIGFIVIPFAFIYNPALILMGSIHEIIISTAFAAMGIISISAGLEGFFLRRVKWWERTLMICGGVMMLSNKYYISLVAMAIVAGTVLLQIKGIRGSPTEEWKNL